MDGWMGARGETGEARAIIIRIHSIGAQRQTHAERQREKIQGRQGRDAREQRRQTMSDGVDDHDDRGDGGGIWRIMAWEGSQEDPKARASGVSRGPRLRRWRG